MFCYVSLCLCGIALAALALVVRSDCPSIREVDGEPSELFLDSLLFQLYDLQGSQNFAKPTSKRLFIDVVSIHEFHFAPSE